MQSSARRGTTRQGHIQLFLFQRLGKRGGLDGLCPFVERGLERHFDPVRGLTDKRLLLFGEFPKPRKDLHQRRSASELVRFPHLKRLLGRDRVERIQRGFLDIVQLILHSYLQNGESSSLAKWLFSIL
jgi:hypothetical protein